MIKVIHDITNTAFRNPAGPGQAGFEILLTLDVIRSETWRTPYIHILFDKDSSIATIPLTLAAWEEHDASDKRTLQRRQSTWKPQHPAGSLLPLPEDPGYYDSTSTVQRRDRLLSERSAYVSFHARFTPPRRGLYWYWFELVPAGESPGSPDSIYAGPDPGTGHARIFDNDPPSWQITAYEPSYQAPEWIYGGVYYHIFVDRFAHAGKRVEMEGKITRSDWGGMPEFRPTQQGKILNNDFFGGNLAGVREKLPYLHDLGVTCLYLSPIFEAFSSHKYDTTDYMKVDPMFGDEKEFTRLCKEANKLGIRIICDGVFSHTGSDSRYFDINDRYGDGAYHHPDSPYRDWYYFDSNGYQSWWGIDTLPRINKENPSYQEFITGADGVVRHWLRAGASGWRLDVVDELPASFLEKLTAAAKEEKADAMVLGEVWEDASNKIAYDERKNYFEGDKLDSVMNYPVRQGIIDYVRDGDAWALARPVRIMIEHYPPQVVHAVMNILGTHDTERIITALAGQKLGPDASREQKAMTHMDATEWENGIRRLKIAVVLQMTLPGVPCIYYGDEAGMEGYNDPFNRRCYPWGHENPELQNWYRSVIRVRRSSEVYADGSYRLLAAQGGLFAFERAKAGQRRITVTNCGDKAEKLHLFGNWQDLLSGIRFCDDVPVLPGQAMILVCE